MITAYVEEALEGRAALTDLLVREIEDACRITGATVTGIGRWVANDPSLYADLKFRGRVPREASLVAWHDAVSDFVASCAPDGGSATDLNTP